MKFSNVLFIGLGGAGQRHLRILKQLLSPDTSFSAYRRTSKTPLLRPDFSVNTHESVRDAYQLRLFEDISAAFAGKPDLTVISTPSACHLEPLQLAVQAGSGIIVEKPWSDTLEGFSAFRRSVLAQQLPFMISFQRRYHQLIVKAYQLFTAGKIGKPMAASFNVFSDVTTWHGYESWQDLYAVRKDLGGGVLLTEIHEIDLAYWFFGMPDTVYCMGGNRGKEKLEVEDTVQLSLDYETFSVQITLCFMHKRKARNFHIAGTDGDIIWNEEGNILQFSSFDGSTEKTEDSAFTNDSMFIAQAKHFVSNWTKKDTEDSLLSAGCSLAIVEAARISMKSGRAEKPPIDFMVADY